MTKCLLIATACLALSGCGAVYTWDTMQLQSARKQAAQVLLADCKAGDKGACERVAGAELSAHR